MKKLSFLLFSLSLCLQVSAQAKDTDQVKLNLPWDQLQQLLKLNQDEVRLSWEEFQALAQRTTQKSLPKFSISNGEVVLTREEFKRLVNSLLPPPAEPSVTYITKGTYKGKVVGESISVSAILELQLDKKDDKPIRIDLFPGNVAFRDISFDDGPAMTELENGRLYLTTKVKGHHTVKLQYSIKNLDGNKNQLATFPIQRTSITKVEFEVPEPNVEISVADALQNETRAGPAGTSVSAVLPPTDSVRITWHTEIPQKEKGPAKVYVDGNHLISIEEDALRVRSVLNMQVLKNSINSVSVEIPKGFSVIDVQGESLKEWTESGEDVRLLQIPFEFARQGSFQIIVTCEQIFTENKVTPSFSGFKIRGATREKGFLGVELRTPAEASVAKELNGLDRIDIQELPADLISLSNRPLLFGFKYLRQPFDLGLNIERHTDVQVLSSVIDSANGVSWLTEDGKLVHQITYRLRNTWKQFLEVKLPEQAKLWSVFVGGQPAKPSENEKGKLLIPLSRSQNVSGNLTAFDVELVYYEQTASPFLFGRHNLQFPIPDMIVSNMSWSVYLPQDELYGYFGKDLEKDQPVQTATRATTVSRRSGARADKGFFAANKPQSESLEQDMEMMVDRLEAIDESFKGEAEMTSMADAPSPSRIALREGQALHSNMSSSQGRVAGVLPVRARIPVTGQSLRFSKTLIVKEVPIQLPLYYVSKGMILTIKFMLLGLGFFIVIRFRREIAKLAQALIAHVQPRLQSFKPFTNPFRLVVVTVVLSLLASYLSTIWLVLSLLAFTAALTRWLLTLIRIPQGGRV